MAYSYWTNVGVAIQSALGAAKAFSSITAANPGVASFTDDPSLSDGDYVVLKSVATMYQVENLVARITAGSGSGPYLRTLESVNTAAYSAATGGNAYEITFGTTLAVATGITVTGGEPEFTDITRIHDSLKVEVPTRQAPFSLQFDCLWDPSDAGLTALKVASDGLLERALRLTFSNGYKVVFNGYVSTLLLPTGNAGEAVKTGVTIRALGRPTAYTS